MELMRYRVLLFAGLFVLAFSGVLAESYYKIDLYYSGGEMDIVSVDYVFLRGEIENPSSEEFEQFTFEVFDFNGALIHQENVSIIDFDYVENLTGAWGFNEFKFSDEFNYTVYLPYFVEGREITLKKSLGENWGFRSHEITELKRDLETFESESGSLFFRGKSGSFFYFVVFVLVLVVISVVLYFYFNRKKKNSKSKGK